GDGRRGRGGGRARQLVRPVRAGAGRLGRPGGRSAVRAAAPHPHQRADPRAPRLRGRGGRPRRRGPPPAGWPPPGPSDHRVHRGRRAGAGCRGPAHGGRGFRHVALVRGPVPHRAGAGSPSPRFAARAVHAGRAADGRLVRRPAARTRRPAAPGGRRGAGRCTGPRGDHLSGHAGRADLLHRAAGPLVGAPATLARTAGCPLRRLRPTPVPARRAVDRGVREDGSRSPTRRLVELPAGRRASLRPPPRGGARRRAHRGRARGPHRTFRGGPAGRRAHRPGVGVGGRRPQLEQPRRAARGVPGLGGRGGAVPPRPGPRVRAVSGRSRVSGRSAPPV
ncbi:MAG: hypothetical protein AVDCRST_MAG50-2836, partial [uncultured Acidimicrobiales bacterium]